MTHQSDTPLSVASGRTLAVVRAMPLEQYDQWLELARQRALDPTVFDEFKPFFWDARISNSRMDSYFTRMALSTLQNYATDAAAGVSFLLGHNRWAVGIGRSIQGTMTNDVSSPRTNAVFYTIPGYKVGESSSDDLIRGIRSSIITDVSVGFYDERYVCGVCSRDLWDSECRHLPGVPTGELNGQKAWAWIEDARLAEVSGVFDGSCPGAYIEKASRMMDDGDLSQRDRTIFETQYRTRLPDHQKKWSVRKNITSPEPETEDPDQAQPEAGDQTEESRKVDMPINIALIRAKMGEAGYPAPEEESAMETQLISLISTSRALTTQLEETQSALGERESELAERATRITEMEAAAARAVALENDLAAANGELESSNSRANELETRVSQMQPLADMGKQYREDLISDTIVAGARALGESFNEETYRRVLEGASIESIKTMRSDWDTIARSVLKSGRQTSEEIDDDAPPAADTTQPVSPKNIDRYRS